MTGEELLLMQAYLKETCTQYDDAIHVMVEKRKNGHRFSLQEHMAALVYAQLTNQTKWSRIVPHLKEIDALFFHYDPQRIKQTAAKYFSDGIFDLKCGNISTRAQMNGLAHNIRVMEMLEVEYGDMDTFILSAPAPQIVDLLSSAKSKYKLSMMGEALTYEYIRNVGIDACKPDTHLRRMLGNARMGCSHNDVATVDETISQIDLLAKETGLTMCAIDNIIWSFCADGYGEVCTATPHCEKCVVSHRCNKQKSLHPAKLPGLLSFAEIKDVCTEFNNDPEKIGHYFISLVAHEPN